MKENPFHFLQQGYIRTILDLPHERNDDMQLTGELESLVRPGTTTTMGVLSSLRTVLSTLTAPPFTVRSLENQSS